MTEKKYEDKPIFIEVFERKGGEQEVESWKDNFKFTQTHKIVSKIPKFTV